MLWWNEIEDSTGCFMEMSIDSMNTHFVSLRKSISPSVGKWQIHIDAYPEKEKEDQKIAEYGFINFNLVLMHKQQRNIMISMLHIL